MAPLRVEQASVVRSRRRRFPRRRPCRPCPRSHHARPTRPSTCSLRSSHHPSCAAHPPLRRRRTRTAGARRGTGPLPRSGTASQAPCRRSNSPSPRPRSETVRPPTRSDCSRARRSLRPTHRVVTTAAPRLPTRANPSNNNSNRDTPSSLTRPTSHEGLPLPSRAHSQCATGCPPSEAGPPRANGRLRPGLPRARSVASTTPPVVTETSPRAEPSRAVCPISPMRGKTSRCSSRLLLRQRWRTRRRRVQRRTERGNDNSCGTLNAGWSVAKSWSRRKPRTRRRCPRTKRSGSSKCWKGWAGHPSAKPSVLRPGPSTSTSRVWPPPARRTSASLARRPRPRSSSLRLLTPPVPPPNPSPCQRLRLRPPRNPKRRGCRPSSARGKNAVVSCSSKNGRNGSANGSRMRRGNGSARRGDGIGGDGSRN